MTRCIIQDIISTGDLNNASGIRRRQLRSQTPDFHRKYGQTSDIIRPRFSFQKYLFF